MWRQDPETTKFFKNKVKFVDYRMKWLVLPYSESYFEETTYMLVKFYQFSCNQEYYKTNSIRKRVWIVYNFSALVICQRSCRISVLCAHFLSDLVQTLKLLIYLSYQLIYLFIHSLFNSLIVCFFVYTFIFFCERHNSFFFYFWDSRFFFMITTDPFTNIKKNVIKIHLIRNFKCNFELNVWL